MRIPNMRFLLKLDNRKVVFIANGQKDKWTHKLSIRNGQTDKRTDKISIVNGQTDKRTDKQPDRETSQILI